MWQCPQRNLTLTLHLGLVSVEASDDALSLGYKLVPSVLASPSLPAPLLGTQVRWHLPHCRDLPTSLP